MKSKLFLIMLLLAAITTIGISQEKKIIPPKGFVLELPVLELPVLKSVTESEKAEQAEEGRIMKLPDGVQSLVGLKGVFIGTMPEGVGLTKKQLQTDVELKLRLAGIKVNSLEEWLGTMDMACLSIGIGQVKVKNKAGNELGGCYSIDVRLGQLVYLVRPPYREVVGITWTSSDTIGICSENDFPGMARQVVKDLMDKFINDYLTANPKK